MEENIDEILAYTFKGLDYIEKNTTTWMDTPEEHAVNAIPTLKNMILRYFNKNK